MPFGDPVAAAAHLVALVGTVDGAVGTDGDAVAVAAETARLLRIPTNPRDAVAAADDKYRQRQAAATAGVPQRDFALLSGPNIDGWSTFPAVVKPLNLSASQGVNVWSRGLG